MPRSSVFRNGRSQAVRLPKAVALPEDVTEVEVIAVGNARLISPAGTVWDTFFDGPTVTDDFLAKRSQPSPPRLDAF